MILANALHIKHVPGCKSNVEAPMSKKLSSLIVYPLLIVVLLRQVSAAAGSEPSVPQQPIPTQIGQVFMVDDFDNKVTQTDMGFNYFAGNSGAINQSKPPTPPKVITALELSRDSSGTIGGSLKVGFDFSGQEKEGPFGGYFTSLLGLTDTLVSLDGSGQEPPHSTPFPGYFLDFNNFYGDFAPMANRTIELVALDLRLDRGSPAVVIKVELKDENNFDVFARVFISRETWGSVFLARRDFNDSVAGKGRTSKFDWNRVSVLSIIVERTNKAAKVKNPDIGAFLVDNIRLIDSNGKYPDLTAIFDPTDNRLRPEFKEAFLDLVRALSFQYFLDFSSTDPRTGGIIQDRSSFADLMMISGVGFQLTAYVIGAERGYISREEAARRVHDILAVLFGHPQGPERVGTIEYQGFFFHFLGINGLRKQNFDFKETMGINESLNTVELSTIDSALAIAGVVVVGQYFDGAAAIEADIRRLANAIYARVNWPFMLAQLPDGKKQFFLGWKLAEERDDDSGRFGRFKLNDHPVNPLGQYSSKPEEDVEVPATLDFYTDEAVLIALLAMGSPNPEHRLDRSVWDDLIRQGNPFVKTFPGSLFSYQFGSVWLNTKRLGADNHPDRPVNFFENTKAAILAARQYAIDNPKGRATFNENVWGLSATEGPYDQYFAEAAPPLAFASGGVLFGSAGAISLEGEEGTGDGSVMLRGAASAQKTRLLHNGESVILSSNHDGTAQFELTAHYSNDGSPDAIDISIDGVSIGQFTTEDTRPPGGVPGDGWNEFFASGAIGEPIVIAPGEHEIRVTVTSADPFGVEIDVVELTPLPVSRPLEVGTATIYGVGSSIVHLPGEAIAALAASARIDLNQNGRPDLLHPRFGFVDAFNLNVADAVIPGAIDPNESRILRTEGPWANFTGFAIDHGPMLVMIDNYLHNNFIPSLFAGHPEIHDALLTLFPDMETDLSVSIMDGPDPVVVGEPLTLHGDGAQSWPCRCPQRDSDRHLAVSS